MLILHYIQYIHLHTIQYTTLPNIYNAKSTLHIPTNNIINNITTAKPIQT